jgi:hypothetical protein
MKMKPLLEIMYDGTGTPPNVNNRLVRSPLEGLQVDVRS